MKQLKQLCLGLAATALFSPVTQAADLSIEIENLSRGTYFTPLLVAAHPESTSLFELGTSATPELQAAAEGGEIAGLVGQLDSVGAIQDNNPATGLLAPGQSTTATLNTDGTSNTQLSIVAMLLPTNDGFVALNSEEIPTAPGVYSYYAKAYDAGTEANNELRGSGTPGTPGFPVPPPLDSEIGNGGSGVNASAEGFVHIHRGIIGDTDNNGGASDANSTRHRWLNPIAKITVTVN